MLNRIIQTRRSVVLIHRIIILTRFRIINMRAQHITFNKTIKTVLKDCKEF